MLKTKQFWIELLTGGLAGASPATAKFQAIFLETHARTEGAISVVESLAREPRAHGMAS